MKNILVILVALLMTAGCTSRSYVNRVPPRNNQYGRYDRDHRYERDRYDHDRYDHDRNDRRW